MTTESKTTYFTHEGPYPNAHSDLSPALRFLANYTARIDSADYNCSYLPYYHPKAVFHDATGVDYVGGRVIWDWIIGLFHPFSKIYMETRHCLVTTTENSAGDTEHQIFCEWYAHFWVKGVSEEEGGKVSIPRAMVFTLGKAEGDAKEKEKGFEGSEAGFEGLQIVDARLYYDRSLLVPLLRRSEQEKEKFGN